MQSRPKKIMVFGTFDGIHPGHLNFFQQARDLAEGSFLIVSIARDDNVKKIKKKFPSLNENKRKKLVEDTNIPDKVVLGGLDDHMPHILAEAPDIIALGYDQVHYVHDLEEKVAQNNLVCKIVRLKPFKENIYKNSFLNKS